MKKIFLINIILLLLFAISCKEEEVVYKTGDQVVIDNVVYEYMEPTYNRDDKQINMPIYDYKTVDINDPNRPLYFGAYPIDMIHPENYPYNADNCYMPSYMYFETEEVKEGVYSTTDTWYVPYYGNNLGLELLHSYYYTLIPGFWVVGLDDYAKDYVKVNIKNNISGFVVLGIAYGAFNNTKIDELYIEDLDRSEVKEEFVFCYSLLRYDLQIMPYAFSNAKINGKFISDRPVRIYPLAFNTISSYDSTTINFNNTAYLHSQAFYKCKFTEYPDFWNSNVHLLWPFTFEVIMTQFPFDTGSYTIPFIDPPFVDCEFHYVNAYNMFAVDDNEIYYYYETTNSPTLNKAIKVLISNCKDVDGNYSSKPKALSLDIFMLYHSIILDNKYGSYLFDNELNSELENIYLNCPSSDPVTLSYEKSALADYYIDEYNVLYHLRTFADKQVYIEIVKIPENCQVSLIDFYA